MIKLYESFDSFISVFFHFFCKFPVFFNLHCYHFVSVIVLNFLKDLLLNYETNASSNKIGVNNPYSIKFVFFFFITFTIILLFICRSYFTEYFLLFEVSVYIYYSF